MPAIDFNSAKAIKLGSDTIDKVMLGNDQVWPLNYHTFDIIPGHCPQRGNGNKGPTYRLAVGDRFSVRIPAGSFDGFAIGSIRNIGTAVNGFSDAIQIGALKLIKDAGGHAVNDFFIDYSYTARGTTFRTGGSATEKVWTFEVTGSWGGDMCLFVLLDYGLGDFETETGSLILEYFVH